MKKTILYLSITSLLTIPNTIATEVASRSCDLPTGVYGLVETLQVYRAQNESLRDQLETQGIKMAMDASLEEQEREDLVQALAFMTQEKGKEQVSKEALQRLVDIMKQEQREAKQLLQQVLEELIPQVEPPIPQADLYPTTEVTSKVDLDETETPREEIKAKEAITIKETAKTKEAEQPKQNKIPQGVRMPYLSPDQQKLLFQRNLIGDRAWAALDGKNPSLSAKLCEAIQGWPGKPVDILYQDQCSFTLRVSGKKQDKPYKF